MLVVADVHVDHRGAGGLARDGRLDELLERGRQLRAVGLGGLGAGGRDGDEERLVHGRIVSELPGVQIGLGAVEVGEAVLARASTATSIVCPVNRIASGSAASATTARAP